jgi:hypothetical protein
MCYCDPKIRTPWCHSHTCQERLKLYQVGSVPAELQGFITEFEKLKAAAKEATGKLAIHRFTCKHPEQYVTKVGGSSTGNWCESDDSYWYDCTCTLCESRWTEDQ